MIMESLKINVQIYYDQHPHVFMKVSDYGLDLASMPIQPLEWNTKHNPLWS